MWLSVGYCLDSVARWLQIKTDTHKYNTYTYIYLNVCMCFLNANQNNNKTANDACSQLIKNGRGLLL